MTADLVLVLFPVVGDDIGDEDGKDVFEEFESEIEAGPVVALLENVQDIACYVSEVQGEAQTRR